MLPSAGREVLIVNVTMLQKRNLNLRPLGTIQTESGNNPILSRHHRHSNPALFDGLRLIDDIHARMLASKNKDRYHELPMWHHRLQTRACENEHTLSPYHRHAKFPILMKD
jgi:hypothetical protein